MQNNVGDVARRTWDEAAYAARASQRLQNGEELLRRKVPPEKRKELTARERSEVVDFDALAGSSVVVPDHASKSEAGGFYCRHCDVLLHDSSAYLNHINGRAHQAVIGVAMHVRRSTREEVRAAFEHALARRQAAQGQKRHRTLAERIEQRKAREMAAKAQMRANNVVRNDHWTSRETRLKGVGTDAALPRNDQNSENESSRIKTEMQRLGLPTSF